jgi:hypothetical protein
MGTFGETTIVGYRFSFAGQDRPSFAVRLYLQHPNEICHFRFPFQQTKGCCHFP